MIIRHGGKKLSTTKSIKLYVVAYRKAKVRSGAATNDASTVTLAKSITAYVVGKNNGKYSDAKEITLSKTSDTLKKGERAVVQAKTVLEYPDRKPLPDSYAKEFRYASTNKAVASVDKKGRIVAKKKGNCIIYIYARNGISKKITLTVK